MEDRYALLRTITDQLRLRYKELIFPNGVFFQKENGVVFCVGIWEYEDGDDAYIVEYANNAAEAEYNILQDGDSFYLSLFESPQAMLSAIFAEIDAAKPSEHPMVKCPCCGQRLLDEYDICEVCSWEHDPIQAADPNLTGGANTMSLNQARDAFYRMKMEGILERRGDGEWIRHLPLYLGCRVIVEIDPWRTYWGEMVGYVSEKESEDGKAYLMLRPDYLDQTLKLAVSEILNVMEISS